MAEIRIAGAARRAPETHVFLFEESSVEGLPTGARRLRGPDTVAVDAGRRGTFFLRRVKSGASRLAALRAAVRQAAESMQQRKVRRARFEFPAEADALASALLPHLALADY